jgi:hypothetical protein
MSDEQNIVEEEVVARPNKGPSIASLVLAVLRREASHGRPWATPSDLIEATGLTREEVTSALAKLGGFGLVTRTLRSAEAGALLQFWALARSSSEPLPDDEA